MRRIAFVLVGLLVLAWLVLMFIGSGNLGNDWGAGEPNETPITTAMLGQRAGAIETAADEMGVARPKQILFGDLHVHSTYSLDAFMMALPTGGGEGAHPVSDACDFARHCSGLDFWSINDHAIAITETAWDDTVEAIRQCNAVTDAANPDMTTFLGWEWTQMGTHPGNHYGHKNVIIRGLADDEIPTRPIAAATPPDATDRDPDQINPGRLGMGLLGVVRPSQDTFDLIRYFDGLIQLTENPCDEDVPVRDLPGDCFESTVDPAGLFAKLDDWGFESMVIPHGTTWGLYTPRGSAWDKQLVGDMHDPNRQQLIEVYSGHGNSEEYRDWKEIEIAADGTRSCPAPRDDFLPSCWQAGRIIESRCLEVGESAEECANRAATARQHFVDAGLPGHSVVPGVKPEDWLDSDQCRDCFQPSFNYRPKSSVQYIMALRNFDDPDSPRRFDFGFMASSDNHLARPGTGYKEVFRTSNTEARLPQAGGKFLGGLRGELVVDPEPRSLPYDPDNPGSFFNAREAERSSSFFLTGGLTAVHSEGRDREAIWDAMERKEVYGTSGPRILLWFDLLNAPGSRGRPVAMGGEAALDEDPIFQVRAVGSFEQKPGCPADSLTALGSEETERLCRGECYHPSDERRQITRIEIVKVRPQIVAGEPVEPLIEDPWRIYECDPNPEGCAVTFTDADFQSEGRDALYYVRAIEAPILAINADGLRCEFDELGQCLSVDICYGDSDPNDDCLAETEQRAWSSPIFIERARTSTQAATPLEPHHEG